ncbi:hypothetical protein BC826DRAFT_1022669 [Russula brevipes]|nr:hypothetical protein BC826DRAFT_1022669 [Russula brevipes]
MAAMRRIVVHPGRKTAAHARRSRARWPSRGSRRQPGPQLGSAKSPSPGPLKVPTINPRRQNAEQGSSRLQTYMKFTTESYRGQVLRTPRGLLHKKWGGSREQHGTT